MTHRRRPRSSRLAVLSLAVPLVAVVLLAACGGGDEPEPRVVEGEGAEQVTNPDADADGGAGDDEPVAGVPNPCDLVTVAEVEQIGQLEVSSTRYQQLGPGSVSCNHQVDAEGTVGTSVGISVEQAEAELATYDELEDTEAVDDLGTQASWSPTLGALAVLQDDVLLTISLLVGDDEPDELRERAVELAAVALERL